MTRFSKTVLLMGLSVVALNACSSDKGPGAIGSKDDIVVRNHGIPGAVQEAAAAPAGESVEPTPPAVEAAAQAIAAENAPLGTAAATPVDDGAVLASEPAVNSLPVDQVAPADRVRDQGMGAVPSESEMAPVAEAATSAPAPAPVAETAPATTASSVYPASDYATAEPAAAQAAAPTSAPVAAAAAPMPVPAQPAPASSSAYPLDPDAPYSPSAVAAAQGSAPSAAPVTAGSSEASKIAAAKTALKAKGLYTGSEDGTLDAAFLNALTLYQGVNNLPQGGLNAETMKHLGIAQ